MPPTAATTSPGRSRSAPRAPTRACSSCPSCRAGGGGVHIYWQAWYPEAGPRALFVVAHGASEHGGRYAWVAERLARRGFASYAADHRGHGRSEGPRALVDRMANVVRDLDSVV